ncbi:unnamed protein product [Prunus armeniaca]
MRRSIGALNAQARLAGHHCPDLREPSFRLVKRSNGLWAFDTSSRPLSTLVRPLRLSREPRPFVSNSSANIKACPSSSLPYAFRNFRHPTSVKPFSQLFNPFELHISALQLFPPSYPPLLVTDDFSRFSCISLKTLDSSPLFLSTWLPDVLRIAREYKCLSPSPAIYLVAARNLLTEFREATWEHIPREENFAANELAQVATGIQMPENYAQRIIKVGKKSLPSVLTIGMKIDVNSAMITEDDWRNPVITYLRYPTLPFEKRVRIMAMNYLMWNEDLVRKSKDEVLLRCLGRKEYMKVMGETHEGICGAHQGGRKMCWLMRRYGYFWPTMMKDCIDYSKGMGNGSHWQDLSSQQHFFIIVATDYFTKWVEAKPVKSTTSQEIIIFIKEQIIQRFGIPESITTDRRSSFIFREMLDMAEAFKFRMLQSTPYYAQANRQVESSNKLIINIIRKMLEKNQKQWYEKLSETLWAYRTSKREATGMTPYALTYCHDAILPMEIAVQSFKIAHQHDLVRKNYSQAMLLELEGLDASRIETLNKLLAGKQAWSPTWEDPFIINQILGMGAYRLQDRDGEVHAAPINGKWLKKFFPTMWDSQAVQTDLGIEREQH